MIKSKIAKIILSILLIVLIVIVAFYIIKDIKHGDYKLLIADKNWEAAAEEAIRLNDIDALEECLYLMERDYHYEGLDISKAAEFYGRIDTEDARDKAARYSAYLKYCGTYIDNVQEKETLRIYVKNNKIYYEVTDGYYERDVHAEIGERIEYGEGGLHGTLRTAYLDMKAMVLVYRADDRYADTTTIRRYVSVNSPQYKDESYLDEEDDYYYYQRELLTNGYSNGGINTHSNINSSSKNDSNNNKKRKTSGKKIIINEKNYDPADYDDPEEYADDAWGNDYDDWDDAYDAWEEY